MSRLERNVYVTLVLTWKGGAESRGLVRYNVEAIVDTIDEAVNETDLPLTGVRVVPATREEWGEALI